MRLAMATAAALAACSSTAAKAPPMRLPAKEIVQRSKPAIVRIETIDDRVGTGFALDASGVIATNLHVVAGAGAIRVKLLDGTAYDVTRVLAVDGDRDLALLDIDPKTPLPTIPLGDSDAVSAGDPVLAIGNPLGVLDYTVSDGLISSVRVLSERLTVLQISAPISQGSSGGPLFNPYGEVIGIATAIFAGGQNLNFAIPGNYLRPMLRAKIGISVAEFAARTRPPDERGGGGSPRIERKVPFHPPEIFAGCSDSDLGDLQAAIASAIESGAPLYNQGNHEACFRIYEGTAVRFERDSPCKGIREAFGYGLLRASTLGSFTEKAWALRDTFDGLLDVLGRARPTP